MDAAMAWVVYFVVVLLISGGVGRHIRKFDAACTEMTGMMLGMTMGMLNGFVLGFAAAAGTNSMFWGNLFGILFGLLLGAYFGRAGGLMGVMDGAMGGLMAGAMGAMLAVMVRIPEIDLLVTAGLLTLIYVAGLVCLVALVEQRAPEFAGLHRLAPLFARYGVAAPASGGVLETAALEPGAAPPNYYDLLDLPVRAGQERVAQAYLAYIERHGEAGRVEAGAALATLSNPAARAAYDRELTRAAGLDDCCPPPRHATRPAAAQPELAPAARPEPVRAACPAPARAGAASVSRAPRPARRRSAALASGFDSRWLLAVAAGVVIVVAVIALAGAGASAAAGASPVDPWYPAAVATVDPQLAAKAVTAPLDANGVQTLDLVVNGDTMSYRPSVIKVKQNVPVQLTLRVEGRDPGCGRFVGLRGLGEHGIATPGEVTAFTFTPKLAGSFEINCSMNMMRPGRLIVESQ
jgi:hypothetical protein